MESPPIWTLDPYLLTPIPETIIILEEPVATEKDFDFFNAPPAQLADKDIDTKSK